jgi:3' exoribonuclease, RNase T-like
MSTHIMIDLETLGTTADAAILSIGAVVFDLETGMLDDTFYRVVSFESQPNRVLSRDTLAWWMKQSPEAAAVFTDKNKFALQDALRDFAVWVPCLGKVHAWSNGADFDLPMLTHAFDQCGLRQPWPTFNGRCYRTYKNLPGARDVKVIRVGEHHNALDDAIYQAEHVCKIHQALFMTAVAGQPIKVPA